MRATCRCGHILDVPEEGSDRVVCPKCAAKIRVRRVAPGAPGVDGYIRFSCPCGRRLKVKVEDGTYPPAGKCPDCSRIVPVPSSGSHPVLPSTHPEAQTAELDAADVATLEAWARGHLAKSAVPAVKAEAGLRVCPGCGRPVHLSAVACRECGAHVPKR
jgi:hypothetical protein